MAAAAGRSDGIDFARGSLNRDLTRLSLLGGDVTVGARGSRHWGRWSPENKGLYLGGYVTGGKDTLK